jgi:hypothetical protein
MIENVLKKFDEKRTDTTYLPFLRNIAKKSKSPYKALSHFLISMISFTEKDTFKKSDKYARSALKVVEKEGLKQSNSFKIPPTIQYFQLMEPKKNQIEYLKKHRKMLIPYSKVLYHHAKLFYNLQAKTLLYEANSCFKVLNRFFYNEVPEVKKMADDIQLWMMEIAKDLPME